MFWYQTKKFIKINNVNQNRLLKIILKNYQKPKKMHNISVVLGL